MIILLLLSTFGLSLIHLELVDVLSLSQYQLVGDHEDLLSDNFIRRTTTPTVISIGLSNGVSNFTSISPDFLVENQSILGAKLIAYLVENNLKQAASTLLVTSLDPRMETAQYASNISERYMGISKDVEADKRDIAKQILSLDKDFGSVYFSLPNGDAYLGEPYAGQIQLPRLNYADRDWYKGIFAITNNINKEYDVPVSSPKNSSISANGAIIPIPPYYISEVFQSASIHVPATAIAVPVYDKKAIDTVGVSGVYEGKFNSSSSENSVNIATTKDTSSGYWVGVLNMNETRNYINQLDLSSQNLRAVVVDHNGTAVIDTLQNKAPQREIDTLKGNSSSQTMLADLQGVKRGLNGEIGSIVENVNGTRAIISYHPIEASPHTWVAILMDLDSGRI